MVKLAGLSKGLPVKYQPFKFGRMHPQVNFSLGYVLIMSFKILALSCSTFNFSDTKNEEKERVYVIH